MKMFAIILAVLLLVPISNAHLFGGEGPIGILLITEPDEPPIPGKEVDVVLSFVNPDTYDQPIAGLDVKVNILRGGNTVFSGSYATEGADIKIPFTFELEDYFIDVNVQANDDYTGPSFFPIDSRFEIALTSEEEPVSGGGSNNFYYLIGIIVLVAIAGVIVFKRG